MPLSPRPGISSRMLTGAVPRWPSLWRQMLQVLEPCQLPAAHLSPTPSLLQMVYHCARLTVRGRAPPLVQARASGGPSAARSCGVRLSFGHKVHSPVSWEPPTAAAVYKSCQQQDSKRAVLPWVLELTGVHLSSNPLGHATPKCAIS